MKTKTLILLFLGITISACHQADDEIGLENEKQEPIDTATVTPDTPIPVRQIYTPEEFYEKFTNATWTYLDMYNLYEAGIRGNSMHPFPGSSFPDFTASDRSTLSYYVDIVDPSMDGITETTAYQYEQPNRLRISPSAELDYFDDATVIEITDSTLTLLGNVYNDNNYEDRTVGLTNPLNTVYLFEKLRTTGSK